MFRSQVDKQWSEEAPTPHDGPPPPPSLPFETCPEGEDATAGSQFKVAYLCKMLPCS